MNYNRANDLTEKKICPVCKNLMGEHSIKEIVDCALKETNGGVNV